MPLRRRDEELLRHVIAEDEEPQILQLMGWLAAVVICLGISVLTGFYAFAELRVNWPATAKPIKVQLYDLENGMPLPGNHIEIGPHISMASLRVNDTYPVFSIEDTAIENHVDVSAGEVFEADNRQLLYRLRKCRFLVRNRVEAKSDVHFESGVKGLVTGRAVDLNLDEDAFEKINIRNPSQVYILEVDREPNIWPGLTLAVVSAMLLLVTMVLVRPFFRAMKKFSYD